ncbi:protein NRT1/ PTR FAMILY 5.5 [Sesamum angolense]|uniref:Protein NRT1/ PTR FAMILY 5.5 n=1 Tax=Sesamum angolense TaxID=2727404 RepID=A0AAE2BSH3_9LAMI|nr:protein NRT1/ PTR FAMILY 5.5 [Sesamum angolense]
MATVGRVVVLLWVDILAMYAMYVMMAYLTNVWKLGFTHAAAIVNVFWGIVTVLPLLLAFLVDTILGNYWMLLISSFAYSAGLGFLTMSTPPVLANATGTCSEYKPECIGQGQKVLFYTALPLIAFGMSGHLTSWNSFIAEQFSGEEDDLDENTFWRFFFSIFAVVITTIVAVLALPYIKPWSLRFGIPAICTLVATLLFFSGSCSYKYFRPAGSPLTMFVRVFVAATSKLFYRTPRDATELYEIQNPENYSVPHTRSLRSMPLLSDFISINNLYIKNKALSDTRMYTFLMCRCLDKAAILIPTKPREEQEKNIWRLCRVTEVEETKTIMRMIPVWMTFVLCGVVSSIGLTYFIEQLDHLNHKVGRLTVPSVALLWFYEQAQNQCTKLYAKFSNALAESGSRKFAPSFGIAVSMILAILCCITAAKVENRRLGMVQKHGLVDKPDETVPMTMFWLLPQFVCFGHSTGFSITAPFASSSTNPLPRHEITCSFSLVACLVLGYLECSFGICCGKMVGVFYRYKESELEDQEESVLFRTSQEREVDWGSQAARAVACYRSLSLRYTSLSLEESLLWADILVGFAFFEMQKYLTDVWKLSFTHAAGILNIWGGISLILPVFFLFLVDARLGNFTMLLISSTTYTVGIGFVTMSTPSVLATCKQCIGHTQKALFYTGMALIAVGSAGNNVSVLSFRDEQKDKPDNYAPAKACLKILGFILVVLIPVIGAIALPYIKPWTLRFGIPAICTAFVTFLFWSGWCTYDKDKPKGSPLTNVCRVFVASAFKKSKPYDGKIYKKSEHESFSRSRCLRCLEKAAIILPGEDEENNRWRLCSVGEVEEAKIAVRMIPMWLTFIVCGIVLLLLSKWAKTWFDILATCSLKKYKQYGAPIGITVAMIFSVLCCITAAEIETRRLNVIRRHGLLDQPDKDVPMSIFWLLFQFFLLAGLDAFLEKGVGTFHEEQAPKSMKTYLKYFTNAVSGLGFMCSVVSVYVVGKISERGGRTNWFQYTLNRSRLDRYYWVLAALSSVNLLVFILVASSYRYKDGAASNQGVVGTGGSAFPSTTADDRR